MEGAKKDSGKVKTKKNHKFSSPWMFSDVVLVVEDTKFHVHKCRLSMWSPVFDTMFTSQFTERSAKEIPLPGKKASEVLELLNVIYSANAKEQVTEMNCECLLELAREYQMDQVLECCRQYMSQDINQENCLRRYRIAERFEFRNVKKICNRVASSISSTDLKESPDFHQLGFESKFKVCMKRVQKLEEPLRKYAEICSELVRLYYDDIQMGYYLLDDHVPENIQCTIKAEHQKDKKGGLKDFDPSCGSCRRRTPELRPFMDPDPGWNYDHLMIQLDTLQEHDKSVTTIIDQNPNSEA